MKTEQKNAWSIWRDECSAKSCRDVKRKFFAFCLRLIKIWKIQWKKTEQKSARSAETIRR